MLSDEEKKAIDYWKGYMKILHWNTQLASEYYMKILLDLIEKQSKEIEELNYIKRCFDYCVEQKNKKWEDKIKAKIEELDEKIKVKREMAKNPTDRVSGRLLIDNIVELEKTKKVLQSLLEKE